MRPAARGWCVIIGGSLGYDVWLVARGEDPLTACARTRGGWTVCGLIVAHFAGWLPRWLDPFQLVGATAGWLAGLPRGRVLP